MDSAKMAIHRLKTRLNLQRKLIEAIKKAEIAGIKDPLKVLEKSLKNRADLKVRKSHLTKRKK